MNVVDLLGVVEAVVREVVAGEDGPLLGEGEPGDSLTRLEASGLGPVGDDRHGLARRVGPAQAVRLGVVLVDPGAVRFEQPGRLVDDPLEDLGRVQDGRHAGCDLAQRPLGIGAPGDLGPGALQLLDQAGVRDRDGRLVGEGRQQAGVLGIEGVGPVRVGVDDAEHLVAMDQRRGDHRPDRRSRGRSCHGRRYGLKRSSAR